MGIVNDIVREVAAEMLNTSMQEITAERIHGWATRLGDATTCEKSLQVGNAAKMREALVQCELFLGNVSRHGHPTLNPGDKCTACDGADELRGMVARALAETLRNCDVGTAEEQEDRFADFCRKHECTMNCPIKKKWSFRYGHKPSCGVLWAQMPYESEVTE